MSEQRGLSYARAKISDYGPKRRFAATPRYFRCWMISRHCAEIVNVSSLTHSGPNGPETGIHFPMYLYASSSARLKWFSSNKSLKNSRVTRASRFGGNGICKFTILQYYLRVPYLVDLAMHRYTLIFWNRGKTINPFAVKHHNN